MPAGPQSLPVKSFDLHIYRAIVSDVIVSWSVETAVKVTCAPGLTELGELEIEVNVGA